MFTARRVFKILGIAFGVSVLLSIGVGILIFSQLPSPSEMGQSIAHGKSAAKPQEAGTPARSDSSASPEPSEADAAGAVSSAEEATQEARDKAINGYFFRRYLGSEDAQHVEVCQNLHSARDSEPTKKSLGEQMERVARGEKQADPFVEAVMAPIGFALMRPPMKALLKDAQDAMAKDDQSFMKKAGFYARVAAVGADYVRNKSEIEKVSDRAYLLSSLIQLARENPSLGTDPKTLALCDRIQSSVLDSSSDPALERAEFEEYLKTTGISPERIGYDPAYRTHLDVIPSQGSIRLNIGWLDQILNPAEG